MGGDAVTGSVGDASPDVCFDAYVEGEGFDPTMLPTDVDVVAATSDELAVAWLKQWQPGQELRIRFRDGETALHELVEQFAREWLDHANLGFAFGNFPDAEIEVTFLGNGYSSLVGTDAVRRLDRRVATMRLGGMAPETDPTIIRRTVLHEFGHAIGCIHEQASPAAKIPWNEPEVYAYYRRWQGWDEATTRRNVLQRYGEAETRFTAHDPASIMQYPVPAELTMDGSTIGWNDQLSPGDIAFIAKMYPP